MQSMLRRCALARPAASLTRQSAPSLASWRMQAIRTLVTKRYTEDHEFVEFDDETNIGIVGITHYAQNSLGDVVFVELPTQGTEVGAGDQIGAVESVKAASDIFAPVSGTVDQVNEALNDQPGLINKSPDVKGWLCKIKLSDPTEVSGEAADGGRVQGQVRLKREGVHRYWFNTTSTTAFVLLLHTVPEQGIF
ncbi:hypothetical protein CYLTODRAFT_7924 [Cylindrobasidium torrendii FP15055 ss-10]|uniref:Glycine cleavage system H protein n=1 Tax=Cylindrobasidium torrendii FP15055 ss-10 TaxID=1314674 RepID=A0A0D7BQW6_9AGAR|nr:hypothetical protein CYLTODRAFT_7924 [Cylindrobasidium torrendii FP15055 ss-10]